MKLLFDQNISFRILKKVDDIFPNCQQVRNVGLEDKTDLEIWTYAKSNGFMIVTFDADFYDFSLIFGQPPKIIWIRSRNQTTKEVEIILRKHVGLNQGVSGFVRTCLFRNHKSIMKERQS